MEAAKSQGMISLENGLSFEGKTAMEPMESKFERSQIVLDLDEMHYRLNLPRNLRNPTLTKLVFAKWQAFVVKPPIEPTEPELESASMG